MIARKIHTIRISITLLLLACSAVGHAQQEYRFSQVTKSMEFINPAYNATKENINALLIYRDQWTGFEGAPKTFALNVHSPLKNSTIGIGLVAATESVGLRRVVNGGLNVDVRTRLNKTSFLAAGFYAGVEMVNYNQDLTRSYEDNVDVSQYNERNPVVGAGVYFFQEKFQAGASTFIDIDKSASNMTEQLNVNVNIAYVAEIAENWHAKPFLLGKYFTRYLSSAEGGVVVLYRDFIWLGIAHRYKEAMIFSTDIKVNSMFRIGYSFDYPVMNAHSINRYTHEIKLSFIMKKQEVIKQKIQKFR